MEGMAHRRITLVAAAAVLLACIGGVLTVVVRHAPTLDDGPESSEDTGSATQVYAVPEVDAKGIAVPGAADPVAWGDETDIPSIDGMDLVGLTPALVLSPDTPYVVGVTWSGDDVLWIDARVEEDGAWGPWERVSNDHPDEGEGSINNQGTEPYIAVGATAVQFRTSSASGAPADLSLQIYSADGGFEASSGASSGSFRGFSVPQGDNAAAGLTNLVGTSRPLSLATPVSNPQPPIHLRAEWEPRSPSGEFDVKTVQGAVVHHTAGSNSYSPGDVPAILRSIQNYHMDGRGWFDIGYNFLVDRFGRIWEGRGGGIENTTAGVHSHSFNGIATGVSVIGNFQTASVPEAAYNSLVALIAWKLTLHGVSASGNLYNPLDGTFPAIISHRDIPEASTSCPGIHLWNLLPYLRTAVVAQQNLPALAMSFDATGEAAADVAILEAGVVTIDTPLTPWATTPGASGPAPSSTGAPAPSVGPVPSASPGENPLGSTWFEWMRAAAPSDPSAKGPYRRPGLGTLAATGVTLAAPNAVSASVVGDVDGDGLADLVTVETDGRLLFHRSTGNGFDAPIDVPNPIPLPPAPSPTPSPTPSPSPSPSPSATPRGWSEYGSVAGAGDINFDGTPDLVAVDAAGNVVVFTWSSTDPSKLTLARTVARGYVGYRVFGTGAWGPRRVSDLIAVSPVGQVVLLEGKGLTGAVRVGTVSTGWSATTQFWPLGATVEGAAAGVIAYSPDSGTFQYFRWTSTGEWTLDASASATP